MALNPLFAMARSQSPLVVSIGKGPPVIVAKDWYVLLYNLYNGVTQGLPQPEEALTVGASPFSYQATLRGQVLISGGTVSAIEFSRDGGNTFYNAGITAGFVQMCARDVVRITYSGLPAVIFFPM